MLRGWFFNFLVIGPARPAEQGIRIFFNVLLILFFHRPSATSWTRNLTSSNLSTASFLQKCLVIQKQEISKVSLFQNKSQRSAKIFKTLSIQWVCSANRAGYCLLIFLVRHQGKSHGKKNGGGTDEFFFNLCPVPTQVSARLLSLV